MAKFLINGGRTLAGEIDVRGGKNAATKMMIASLLTEDECVLENFPQIGDTKITGELCSALGSKLRPEAGELKISTSEIKTFKVATLSRRNRIPILALGPLLSRCGRAEVPILGGDRLGPRPVDLHIAALESMGAKIEVTPENYVAEAPAGLHGAQINFRFPSVGATENTILAAVTANGNTKISNAAVEPEILDLIKLLQKMGAIIELGADRAIYIEGVRKLRGATHKIIPDRNEAVSFACLAVATGGRVKVRGAVQDHLITFLNALRRAGGEYEVEQDGIIFSRPHDLQSVEIETDAHPGFMTDWQQPFLILLTQARGMSVVHETIYEDRFGYTNELNKMGANIKVFSKCLGELPCRFNGKNFAHSAIIEGPSIMRGHEIKVSDIRAGIAHIIAALAAKGESRLNDIEEIDRGYENIDSRLRSIGADIKRVE